MSTRKILALVLASSAFAICSACGGGGGGGSGSPTDRGDLSVLVRWQPSERAAGYRVHWGTASREYTDVVEVGSPAPAADSTIAVVVELPAAAATYYLAVSAYDQDGRRSEFSNELSVDAP